MGRLSEVLSMLYKSGVLEGSIRSRRAMEVIQYG